MKRSNIKNIRDDIAYLYERISRDDDLVGDSYSIANQKKLLIKAARVIAPGFLLFSFRIL